MKRAVISIPIYKPGLSEFEKVSLVQCCKILNKYDFSLVCPEGMEIGEYEEILKTHGISFKAERFDKEFFKSVKTYNRLMLDADFYRRYQEYEFLLVYQLDAYVFRDEIEYWCQKNFDYIGAPWFEKFSLGNDDSKLLEVAGNGGFSLRKTSSFINVLSNTEKAKKFIDKYVGEGKNEDLFFSQLAKNFQNDFRVAPPGVAMLFSFEFNPQKLYEMTGKLPFGCHAWERYGFDFWEKHIDLGSVDVDREFRLNLENMAGLKNKLVSLEIENDAMGEKIKEIQQISEQAIREKNIILSSAEWKMASMMQKTFKLFFPKNSARREFLIALWKKRIIMIKLAKQIKSFFLYIWDLIVLPGRPLNKRSFNSQSKKLVYVGHSYHNKTKSTGFLLDYLKEFFEVEVVSDNSWQGGGYPDLSFVDESYLGVIFFQILPPIEIVKKIKNENIIYFPMYDQSGLLGYDFWRKYRDLKIMNFSSTLHQKLKRWKFETIYVQYFPKPQDFAPGKKDEVFFWQRLTEFNIDLVEKLLGPKKARIHLHRAIDPGHSFLEPSEKQRNKYSISQSEWFETREEMWDVIKQKGIYIAPRKYEGIGMSFLEAMAMGKAVIAVNNPTMNEYINHGRNGYLFNLKSPKAIDLSNIEEVQEATYDYMKKEHVRWRSEREKIIQFIKLK